MTGKEYHELMRIVKMFKQTAVEQLEFAQRPRNASIKGNLEGRARAWKEAADELERRLGIMNS